MVLKSQKQVNKIIIVSVKVKWQWGCLTHRELQRWLLVHGIPEDNICIGGQSMNVLFKLQIRRNQDQEAEAAASIESSDPLPCFRTWAKPEGTSKVTLTPKPSLSPFQFISVAAYVGPQLTGRRNATLGLRMAWLGMWAQAKVNFCCHVAPLPGGVEKHRWREVLPMARYMGSIPDHLLYDDRWVVYINMYRKIYTVVNGLLVGRESKRRNTGGKRSGKRHMGAPMGVGTKWEDLCITGWQPPESIHHGRGPKQPRRRWWCQPVSVGSHLSSDTVQPRQRRRLHTVPIASALTHKVDLFLLLWTSKLPATYINAEPLIPCS